MEQPFCAFRHLVGGQVSQEPLKVCPRDPVDATGATRGQATQADPTPQRSRRDVSEGRSPRDG